MARRKTTRTAKPPARQAAPEAPALVEAPVDDITPETASEQTRAEAAALVEIDAEIADVERRLRLLAARTDTLSAEDRGGAEGRALAENADRLREVRDSLLTKRAAVLAGTYTPPAPVEKPPALKAKSSDDTPGWQPATLADLDDTVEDIGAVLRAFSADVRKAATDLSAELRGAIAALDARLIAVEARPVLADHGVHEVGKAYPEAAVVTFRGGMWIAQRDTTGTPGTPDSGWRLAVKAGRDGRDAR
ncbi:MAG: hypothetical protein GC206_17085 [Alphaproteobacteria bacterium]|nr:hypothetical protein [Alphaproteobacteria bacterium]